MEPRQDVPKLRGRSLRIDTNGIKCPATLAEYRDQCIQLGGRNCDAVKYLMQQIAKSGPDTEVTISADQMRALLTPMLLANNHSLGQ